MFEPEEGRRSRLLDGALRAFVDAGLDYDRLLPVVVERLVEAVDDSCALLLRRDDDVLELVAVHALDSEVSAGLTALLSGHPALVTTPILASVVTGGEPLILNAIDQVEFLETMVEDHRGYVRDFPIHSLMLLPLPARGRVIGILALARHRPDTPFTPAEIALATDVAGRAALVIDNAELHRTAGREVAQRLTVESELRQSEERYRRLAENAPVVIYRYRLGPDPGLEFVSPAVTDLLGYEPEDFYRDPFLLIANADPQESESLVEYYTTLSKGPATSLPKRRIHRDGRVIWTETRAVPVLDDAGEVVAIEGITLDITALKDAEAVLLHRASHDDLTGLANRTLFLEAVGAALTHRPEGRGDVAVLFIDLDRFKVINDGLGHAQGDVVLGQAAQRLLGVVRPGDLVARQSGDEFAVLIDETGAPDAASAVADRILHAFRRPFAIDDLLVHSTVSIGLASLSAARTDLASDLLRYADAALFRAKELGRDRLERFDESLRSRLEDRLQLESELRAGLEHGQFLLHYQPVYGIGSGRIEAAEVLVRWNHPTRGLLAAAAFIDAAEESGLVVPLGTWVLEETCRQQRAWLDRGIALRVAVNLSASQLNQPEAVDLVLAALAAAPDPSAISFEITETSLMRDVEQSLKRLGLLKEFGAHLAVDDFGTGYSSLSYLQQLPIDTVKIDKSFVDGLGTEDHDSQIVNAIISLARALHLGTVAEGVETEQQLQVLTGLGCDQAQGYHLGRPMPLDQLEALLGAQGD